MRISDWSSDVCSSDLKLLEKLAEIAEGAAPAAAVEAAAPAADRSLISQHILDELREMGLGEEFVQRFLVECVRDARKCLADLDAAGRKASWEEFRDACHADRKSTRALQSLMRNSYAGFCLK